MPCFVYFSFEKLNSHFLFYLAERLYDVEDIFLAESGGDLRSDAGAALGNDGVRECYDVDALFHHATSHFNRLVLIVEHNGKNGSAAVGDVESDLLDLLGEKLGVCKKLVAS